MSSKVKPGSWESHLQHKGTYSWQAAHRPEHTGNPVRTPDWFRSLLNCCTPGSRFKHYEMTQVLGMAMTHYPDSVFAFLFCSLQGWELLFWVIVSLRISLVSIFLVLNVWPNRLDKYMSKWISSKQVFQRKSVQLLEWLFWIGQRTSYQRIQRKVRDAVKENWRLSARARTDDSLCQDGELQPQAQSRPAVHPTEQRDRGERWQLLSCLMLWKLYVYSVNRSKDYKTPCHSS